MREARRADIQMVVGLMRDFYAESGYELDDVRASAAFAALLDEPRLGQVWLIEHGPAGDVVGYIVVTFVFAMEFGGRMAVVDDFYVRPEARGDGLGKAALAAARRACEELGARAMRVEVGAENAVARAVYRSAGFTELKDHRLMTLPLAKVRDLLE
jgi:GNAT superfamily N-acetyltransferase